MDRREARPVAFGSCNRQDKPQEHWATISSLQPSHWIWTGDAVYAKGNSVEKLRKAYASLISNPLYESFEEGVTVDGVWDDHDFGVNDGGKHAPEKEARQREYASFIARGRSNFTEYNERLGLYHHLDLSIGGTMARFYFLDTRSQRDNHWIRSIGEVHMKGSALIASALRVSYTLLGWGQRHQGNMLGPEQWQHFEDSLRSSTAEVNVIISSVQVLTTNPVFESWGHFPAEKRRLFQLLQDVDPKGLTFLSGDVHLGELSRARFTRSDGSEGEWVEVTSSGLTHTCADGIVNKYLCPFMMQVFSLHRIPGAVFFGKNFGTIESRPDNVRRAMEFSVRSVETAAPVLTHTVLLGQSINGKIVSVDYPSFPVLPVPVQILVLFLIFVASYSITLLISRRRKEKNLAKSR
ncbi:PhoD-like phosphatase-domain-containing protein [Ochromonadaceae sp. CCMP2298]|nr:PhoD-like phosphatase-domain-containing protein [Ochromonadaceae sp. CCMP2298]